MLLLLVYRSVPGTADMELGRRSLRMAAEEERQQGTCTGDLNHKGLERLQSLPTASIAPLCTGPILPAPALSVRPMVRMCSAMHCIRSQMQSSCCLDFCSALDP